MELELKGITKRFPGVLANDRVNLSIRSGEVLGLLGENGAVKSTLMKVFSGTVLKDKGTILIENQEVEIMSPHHARDLGIGMVYQELSLIPSLSVGENIFMGRLPKHASGLVHWSKLYTEAYDLLDEFGLRAHIDPHQRVSTLGIAERQLVEITKALSMRAKILLLDEPTSALSDEERDRLFDIIRRLQNRGVGIVYVSHRLDEVSRIGQRVTVLRDGKKTGTLPVEDVEEEILIQMMVGRELTEQFPKEAVELGREILRVEGLAVTDKLDNITFSLHAGEILGIAGLMGSGRTDLARALFGIDKIHKGEISQENFR